MVKTKRISNLPPLVGRAVNVADIIPVATLTATNVYGVVGATGEQIQNLVIDKITDQELFTVSDVQFDELSANYITANDISATYVAVDEINATFTTAVSLTARDVTVTDSLIAYAAELHNTTINGGTPALKNVEYFTHNGNANEVVYTFVHDYNTYEVGLQLFEIFTINDGYNTKTTARLVLTEMTASLDDIKIHITNNNSAIYMLIITR